MKIFAIVGAIVVAFSFQSARAEPVVLRVFEWEGYISPFADDFAAYAKSHGVEAKLEFLKGADDKPLFVTSSDDIFETTRSEKCDVVTPTNNYFKDSGSRLIKILAPIDITKVPHFQDIVENLRNADYAVENGQRYAVPLLGGGYSLAYNADRVSEPPTSWTALSDPKYKGRTSVTGAQYEANVYVAAILAGVPPANVYNWDHVDNDKVRQILKGMATNVKAMWDSNPDIDLMAHDLDLITDYGFGVAFANQKGQHWKFAKPVEPTTVWIDNISLAPSALATPEKSKAAYLLLDFMLSPEIQARIAEMYGVVVPNPKAADAVAPEKKADIRIGTNEFYRPDLLWQPLDKRTRNGFKAMWGDATAK